MKILSRLLLSILPPILSVIIWGSVVVLQVSNGGVNQQERDFLSFKAQQLENYVISQWNLLIEFRLYYEPDLIRAAQQAISEYAGGLVSVRAEGSADRLIDRLIGSNQSGAEAEVIFALVNDEAIQPGVLAFSTDPELIVSIEEGGELLASGPSEDGATDFAIVDVEGIPRAFSSFRFEPFNWVVYVSESVDTFQRTQNIIRIISILIIAVVLLVATLLIVFLSNTITKPLSKMSSSTKDIIRDIPEIHTTVPVIYNDESGILAQNFNSVFSALNRNYQQLKKYTYNSVVIQKREERVKNIFQKYVPQTLIDRYVQRPEALLQSESRDIAVLFTDIRGFTTISETMGPNEIVKMLNALFTSMVENINRHEGHVDKYIGDALMAIFGAPVQGKNDAGNALNSAITIVDDIIALNNTPEFADFPEIKIGVGVHYGSAVVGNIGCESKIEYTAIGDTVNSASRLEGLCKQYGQTLIISDGVVAKAKGSLRDGLQTRSVDKVAVKGKSVALGIHTIVSAAKYDTDGLKLYESAISDYLARRFDDAITKLRRAAQLIPNDFLIKLYFERAKEMRKAKLPADWNGAYIATSK